MASPAPSAVSRSIEVGSQAPLAWPVEDDDDDDGVDAEEDEEEVAEDAAVSK